MGKKERGQASGFTLEDHKRSSPRPISTAKLNMSPCLHTQPINLIVHEGSYQLKLWDILS